MKRPTKPVYRPEDVIEIVEPLIAVRIGYPLSLAAGITHIETTYTKDIRELLSKTGIENADSTPDWLLPNPNWQSDTFAKIVRDLAYAWVRKNGFGGDVRSIHTELREDLRGRQARVLSKRNVKTGRYCAPSSSYDSYTGEWDGDSGGLFNCRTHVILECQLISDGTVMGWAEPFEIEACHVRHVWEQVPGGVSFLHIEHSQ